MCHCGTCYDLPAHNLPVIIQTPKGGIFLETQSSHTIGQIKTMIQEKLEVPTEELKLVFVNQLLEDEHTLSDYNIQDGATLYIGGMDVHILRGGSRITIRGVLLVQMRAKCTKFLKPHPLSPKIMPISMHIRQSDRATTATGQQSSNLCQGK